MRACNGRRGQCLEQLITEKPIAWGPLPNPFTLAGDITWTDYSVSTDVRFLTDAPAAVIGRIDSSDVFKDGQALWPSAYVLRVAPAGKWELLSAEYNKPVATLAVGSIALDGDQWHHLELSFRGSRITASFDGKPLATVENKAHTHGMVGVGTEWNHIQFDNLRVQQ